MSSLTLFYVGSVPLINGLQLIGVVSAKATAAINVLVGLCLVGVVLRAVLPADGDMTTALGACGNLLFGVTYLYLAINTCAGFSGEGLGWYCGWAVPVSLFLAGVNFTRLADPKFGVLWLTWAVLFAAFFAVLALGRQWLARPTGWFTVAVSVSTTSVPGALLLLDRWDGVQTGVVATAQAVTVGGFLVLALRARARATTAGRTPPR